MNKKLFDKNLKWLKKNNLALFIKIKKTVPENVELVRNSRGDYNLLKTVRGKEYPLYSSYNIARQCHVWLDNLTQAGEKKEFIIIYGLGLGYELKELLRKDIPCPVLLIEPDEEIFYYNLYFFDLSSLEKHDVYFIQDDRAEEIAAFVADVIKKEQTINFFFSTLPGYYYAYKEHIQQLQLIIKEKLNSLFVTVNTILNHDKQWLQNYILNLKQLYKSVPVEKFGSTFEGLPAIMVGAGPSLEYDLDILRESYDKALIVPVGSAFSVLDNHGVKAHAAGAIDGAYGEAKIFAHNCHNQEMALFYSFMVNYKVLSLFKKEKFFFAMHDFDQYIYRQLAQPCVTIASGGSVSISILDILAKMGCSPIILAGQDLCYSNNQTYAKGAIYFEETDEETLKKKGYLATKNKKGETVYTTRPMLAMRAATEGLIKVHKNTRFINCTQNGLPIAGALDGILEKIKSQKFEGSYNFPEILSKVYQNNLDIAQPAGVNAEVHNIEEQTLLIKDYCGRIITILDDMVGNDPVRQIIDAITELEKKLGQFDFYSRVLKEETGVYSFLFSNLALNNESFDANHNLEGKKRYYSKIYELCLIILNAIEYGDQELQETAENIY